MEQKERESNNIELKLLDILSKSNLERVFLLTHR